MHKFSLPVSFAQELSTDLPDHILPPQYEPLMEFQWIEYVQDLKKVSMYMFIIYV